MKIFVSQSRVDKTEEEITTEWCNGVSLIKSLNSEVEIIDSSFGNQWKSKSTELKYLGESLVLLAEVDEAWFLRGWEKSSGCKIIHDCAVAYEIPIRELS